MFDEQPWTQRNNSNIRYLLTCGSLPSPLSPTSLSRTQTKRMHDPSRSTSLDRFRRPIRMPACLRPTSAAVVCCNSTGRKVVEYKTTRFTQSSRSPEVAIRNRHHRRDGEPVSIRVINHLPVSFSLSRLPLPPTHVMWSGHPGCTQPSAASSRRSRGGVYLVRTEPRTDTMEDFGQAVLGASLGKRSFSFVRVGCRQCEALKTTPAIFLGIEEAWRQRPSACVLPARL